MRFLSLFVLILISLYLFLQGRTLERSSEKPIFLRVDKIAISHQTEVEIFCQAAYCPDSMALKVFKKDYQNLWAHLNHLYASNDIIAGKEYYTENWFKQLAQHYQGVKLTQTTRSDISHELYIKNWSTDDLVCTAIDSNVVLEYIYPDRRRKYTTANLAVVLLYQGDHWRIDAMTVLDETLQ